MTLEAFAERVPMPDASTGRDAKARHDALAKPVGALGRLEELAAWLAGAQGSLTPHVENVRVVVFAGDHGVTHLGVSAYPREVTALMVRTFLSGGAVTKYKVRRGTGRIDLEDAMTLEEAEAAFLAGVAAADEEVDSGADLLVPGDMGIGNTTSAAVLTSILTGKDIASVVGRGTGIDDDTWMRKAAAARDAARRGRPRIGNLIDLLAAVGGADIAAMTGFLTQAAARRTPVVLDGVVSGAAALVAQRITYRTARWFLAGHRSPEPAHAAALERMSLKPLLDYKMRLGEGSGALVAVPVVRAAALLLSEMATLAEVLELPDK